MTTPHTEDLMRRVHSYVSRVMNDPSHLQKNRAELNTVVNLWNQLHRLLPNIVKITAEEFRQILTAQAKAPAHERAAFTIDALKEPKYPGQYASETQLAQYQRDLGKYNRMFEMYSKIMANAHEMKKSIIGNIR